MENFCCILAGMIMLFCPAILAVIWRIKTGGRLLAALAAFLACFPIFIIAGTIRSGFSHEDVIGYYVRQGILFGIFEEGGKFLMLRYVLSSCQNRKDAVSYGIGHSAYELFGSAFNCFDSVKTDTASLEMLPLGIWYFASGVLWTVGLTIIIFYGIDTGRSKTALPAAMLLHALCNMSRGIFTDSVSFLLNLVLYAVIFISGYLCWKALETYTGDI